MNNELVETRAVSTGEISATTHKGKRSVDFRREPQQPLADDDF